MDDEEYMKPILPTVPEKCGPPVIPLGHLIEFAVQQIFHELTVLSELLPKKLDSDRKISIVQFAHSTRTLFIKLLAVVKWVKSSKKFESCSSICYFLDQQAQYFVDTADRLVQLAREELVFARLPSFQVASAVDVLTLGTYPRLPLCIKSRFIPDPPITPREEACVLARLNQVIQSRISGYGNKLSPRISKTVIKNGMVTMTVDGEFEVSLTILGERPTTKWTLLNIRILVEDYEIGFGTKLVHPLQVNMLHNVLQLRMDKSQEPLEEVYNLLHSFAQMLQLDVLFCQATQVISGEMRQHAVIERYDRDAGILILNYWLKKTQHNRYTSQYRIKIFADKENGNNGLRVRHFPVGKNLPCVDDRSGRLSINRLLSETVGVRCRERLLRIRERLGLLKPPVAVSLTGKAAPTLTYPLLGTESHDDEMLIVSVNDFSGNVVATVRALGFCTELRELEQLLNERVSLQSIANKLNRLRILLMLERYRKAVAPLPVRIVPENVLCTRLSKLPEIPPDRICLQFIKEEIYYLIVSFSPNEQTGVDIDMHLVSSVERKLNMVRLHPSQLLTSVPESSFSLGVCDDDFEPPAKRSRWLGSTRQLTSAVATLDDRLAFMRICEELDHRNVKYKPLAVEPTVGGLVLHITDFSEAVPSGSDDFFSSMINCCLRLDTRTRVIWPFECSLTNTPLIADFHEPIMCDDYDSTKTKTTVMEIHGSGGVSSPNTSESVSTHMIDRLIVFAHMYDPVKEFAVAYYNHFCKFCNIVAFTYHKLVLAYGTNRNMLMILSWRTQKAANSKQYFYLTFGIGPSRRKTNDLTDTETLWNPHILLSSRLQERFNKRRSLIDLVQYLIDTIAPLSALHGFTRIRLQSSRAFCQMMCYDAALALNLQASISIVDEYRIRLIYGHIHLEFILLANSRIGVRDCSRYPTYAHRLRQFCNSFLSSELRNAYEEKSPSTLGWATTNSGPGSLPTYQVVRSPASKIGSSPMSHMSLSVPPVDSVGSSLRHSFDYRSKTPILLDHDALLCMTSVDNSGTCPLDQYLFALSYLSRLGPALEAFRREHRGSGAHPPIQFRQLVTTPESVRLSVLGAAPPNVKHEPFLVHMNIYLDEETATLKLKLDFEGEDIPSESDIRTAELYFVRCVARLGNEVAVIAFANACRLAAPGAFAAIARVMSVQMNWTEDSPWRPSMQLVMWSQEGSVQRARISPGIVIDQTNINVLILFCLRPARHDPSEKNADASKHLIPLIYNTQSNTVARRGSGADDDATNATTVLSNVSEQYSLTNEPALWPAIYSLAHNFSVNVQR